MAQEPEFNIERATNGLVLSLYLAAALFLGVLFLFVLRDLRAREAPPAADGSTAAVRSAAPAPRLAAPLLAPPTS